MTRPPRVLLYSATPRSDRGGVQRMMDDLEAVLPRLGFGTRRAGPDETAATGGLAFTAETGAGADGRPLFDAVPGALASLARLAALLARVRPDVVDIHFITGEAAYFLALRRLFGFRVVLSAHGGDLLRPTPQIRGYLPRLLRAADAVTVVSGELAAAARAVAGELPKGLHEIPNGVDAAFWCPSEAPVTPGRIVAAGRLLPIKGFDLLIDAVATLPGARLRILGEGAGRAGLQDRIDRNGLAGRVTLVGHVPPERMREEFRQAALFAMPSRGEGMPLALLEALACGCPAVATDVGAIPDVLDARSGCIVPAGDAEALAEALAGGLAGGSAGRAGPTRQGARERAARFSQEACYGAYGDLLHRLSGAGR